MAEFCTITRAVAAFVADGADEGTDPDRLPVQGKITLTPVLGRGDAVTMYENGMLTTVVPRPIEARIQNGVVRYRGAEGVRILAGGQGVNPEKLVWKAVFTEMQASGWSFTLSPIQFTAIPGGEVDLTLVAPVANVPDGTVRGPVGAGVTDVHVDGSYLVVMVTGEAGTRELSRIPLDDVVRAEAAAAAVVAAATVLTELKAATADDRQRAEAAAGESATSAGKAATSAASAAAVAKTEATAAVAAVVDGAPEDLDTIREVAEYAKSNRDITDTLNAAIGNKADKVHTHPITDVTGLKGALAGKVSDEVLYSSAQPDSVAYRRAGTGTMDTGTPTAPAHATTKQYVDDTVAAKIQTVPALPVTPTTGVLYLVTGA